MRAFRHLIFPLLPLLLTFGEVVAQPSVEAKIERLEQTIRLLERRVEVLEEQLRQRTAVSAPASDRASWRKLQRGMTENEVEQLLGSPTRVDAMSVLTYWHYGDSRGRVTFDSRSRTVREWSEP